MSFTKRSYISNISASLPNIKTSLNLATQMRKKDHLLHLDNKRCDFLKSFFVRITTLGLKTWKDLKASLTCLSLGLYHAWPPQAVYLGAIPILRQHIFGLFGPHPPNLSAEMQY